MYNKPLEYLLKNNPEEVISKKGIRIRKMINPIFRRLVPLTSKNKFVIERKSELPKNVPLIFASTHGFRDDIALAIHTIDRNAYILYASIPDFYYSFDGYALWANGVIVVDRKNKDSRKASKLKMDKAIKEGASILIYPEGVWNKTENLVVQKLFPGVYELACNNGALIVPISSIEEKGHCYSIMEEPFDISKYDKTEGLKVLRDKLCSAKWELMEKYSHTTREELLSGLLPSEYWDNYINKLIETANGLYDYEIENTAHFQDKSIVSEEEVFSKIYELEPTKENAVTLAKIKRFH